MVMAQHPEVGDLPREEGVPHMVSEGIDRLSQLRQVPLCAIVGHMSRRLQQGLTQYLASGIRKIFREIPRALMSGPN
jgi:hypothetical protein